MLITNVSNGINMASRRVLKKQINAEVSEIIDQCYDVILESPKSEEKMNDVIDAAVELYDSLIISVNKYKSVTNKSAYFTELETKLFAEVDALKAKVTML